MEVWNEAEGDLTLVMGWGSINKQGIKFHILFQRNKVWPLSILCQLLSHGWTLEKYTFCFIFLIAVLFLSDLEINKNEENIFKNLQFATIKQK